MECQRLNNNNMELLPTTARSSKSSFSFRIDINRRQTIDLGNTYCDQVLGPLYSYMMIFGLSHTHYRVRNSAWKLPLVIYNYGTFVVMIITTIRRFYQLETYSQNNGTKKTEFSILDPVFVMLICHTLLVFSALVSFLLLLQFQKKRKEMFNVLDRGVGCHRKPEHVKKHTKLNKVLIPAAFGLSLVAALIQIGAKLGHLKIPNTPDLFNYKNCFFIFFEGYIIFLAASTIMSVGMIFSQLCLILHLSIGRLIKEMVPDEKDECPLPEQALQQIHNVQVHYQEISNAKNFIEKHFSHVLFYAYGSCIPFTCFLGFITIQNATQVEMAETLSQLFLLISTIFILLFFSIPAFKIGEEGDKLLSASFQMYHETLCEEQDPIVMSRMSFLTFQMHATKLTISAAKFFPMNRKILISLFSAIFTYFLILVQFDAGSSVNCEGVYRTPLIVQPPS